VNCSIEITIKKKRAYLSDNCRVVNLELLLQLLSNVIDDGSHIE
jgi:hypothetical protein